ncbi:UDP-N-acetylglucosamine transferase subunit ALG14 isoform X2 [Gorilla gorilla gorilla]|uniref:UDP-N-acetylglucosamine transferase subunit ALG14 isoform X2 n=1 Tax=Gorilla gorilla gorilla TaxID=9595 RepID=UPI0008F4A504|nr:UDP-N-acetylglucosamine transferase subunit ALG14 homolog isoform X2 [Gorilla gorilla gorilla]
MVCVLILAAAAGAVAVFLILRIWVVLRSGDVTPRESLSILVVAGSGGHTTEILRLLGSLSNAYSPRHYVIADTDEMSANKINSFELDRADRDPSNMDFSVVWHSLNNKLYQILHSPNSKKPGGSAVLALHRFHHLALHVALLSPNSPGEARFGPQSSQRRATHACPVLCNGPGTCVPICVSALLLGILGIKKVIIVYVESICRVETLSMSGKILFHLSDYFIVQWPALKEKYPKSVYLGRIV